MLNYEKWKKLNESFMMTNPMGVKSPNGFLAYNPLNEKAEEEEVDVEEEESDDEEDEDEESDEDEVDIDVEDEESDEDEEESDEEDEESDEDEDHDHEDMQDETGEVEVVEDDMDDDGHEEDKMVVAKKCGYCGSYMKAESTNPEMEEWLESVRSIINPHVNQKLNGDILNEGTIPPQLAKYVKAKKKKSKKAIKGMKKSKKGGCGCCDKCKCGEMKMKVMEKKAEKHSPKMSWKKSPKK